MSGHSKWATTRRQKETTDKKRSASFTRLARAVTIAVKEGGSDASSNFKLRMAIEKAKQGNMPKDNIERAIKRGTGELEGETIEEINYEAIGPENIALIIKVLTDNKNRTVSEIKNILSKSGGKLAGSNSVSWMFDLKGVIRINDAKSQIKNLEEFQLNLIESGAEDFIEQGQNLEIHTQINSLAKIKETAETQNIKFDSPEIEYISKKENQIQIQDKEKIEKLLDALEENEDIEEIYTNIK
ncbi:YebC/PmpR family DNA-binding transcriptional regulator [Candidatus Falkowbacteria bacterium]|nr:YebC/PmpR family DNA-binding transcriptional regulator [Candidatus Falkowbacteria bacterium]